MGSSYTRQESANITTGNTIEASHFNNEYNAIEAAFNGSTGHSHDGTTGEGPQIPLSTSVTGTLPATNGGTGVSNSNTITLGGNVVTAGAFNTSGAYSVTLTATGTTNITLPTTGTIVTDTITTLSSLSITESQISDLGSYITASSTNTLSNKTINTASNTITVVEADISDLQSYLLPSDIGTTVQGYDADTLKADTTDTLTAGYSSTAYNNGTKNSGTFTPDEANGNLQYAVNGGAHTLAPPSNSTTIIIRYTNNGSAGVITTTGFTKVTGAFTTTNGDDFLCYITNVAGWSHLNIVALQ